MATHASAPSISADGRFVAFTSGLQARVYDRHTHQTELVNVTSDGVPGESRSWADSVSADGRFVAFSSYAYNLGGDPNGILDVFVRDRQTGQTKAVSAAYGESNGDSISAAVSGDGRFVAFQSYASNLIPDDTNNRQDIFTTPNPLAWVPGTQVVTVHPAEVISNVNFGNRPLPVTLSGTAGPDTVLFQQVGNELHVTVNGGVPLVANAVAGLVLYLDGLDGADTLVIYDTVGTDHFEIGPTGSRLRLSLGVDVVSTGFETTYAAASGTNVPGERDSAVFYGSSGSDAFSGFEDYSLLTTGVGTYYAVFGFGTVKADVTGTTGAEYGAAAGGTDSACMYDSADPDTFSAGPAGATLEYGSGVTNNVAGFREIYSAVWNGHDGSSDTAYLYGSDGADVYLGFEDFSSMGDGSSYYVNAMSFGTVIGDVTGTVGAEYGAAAGGLDYGFIYDSAGADQFHAGPTTAKMVYESTKTTQVSGADEAWGSVLNGGVDAAYLYGSDGADTFVAFATHSSMRGTGYYNVATGFDRVEADVTGATGLEYGSASGSTDDAYLYDSALNDLYHAEDDWATLDYNYDIDSLTEILARGFNPVWALHTNGTDEADDEVNPLFATSYYGDWN